MINITKEELQKLEKIGEGTFGTIYKKDDKTAYKIYHKKVVNRSILIIHDNPTLSLTKSHFKRLINRSKNLKYTGGIYDMIILDGKFGGVCIPYYGGENLSNLTNQPLKLKIDLSKKIVRNAQELTDNLIFPSDFKLNNIILSNGEIRIIDLDDKTTHVCLTPNPIYKFISINSLGWTIQTLLGENSHPYFSHQISQMTERSKLFSTYSYKKILDYIKSKEIENNIVFIDENFDLETLLLLIHKYNFKCVLVLESNNIDKNKILSIINYLNSLNIRLYDIAIIDSLDKYNEIENTNRILSLLNNGRDIEVYKR